VTAYRDAMAALRDRVGDDTWILACGAPMMPSVGWADSYRTGPDIAFTLDQNPRRDYLRNQLRSTAARGFSNGVWWWVDPDNLILRDPFNDVEATGAAAAQVLAGGVWLLGDDLEALPASKASIALGADIVDLRGGVATPANPLGFVSGFDTSPVIEQAQQDDQVPVLWVLETGETVLLNLSETVVTVDGPGGTELFTGAQAEAGARTLTAGQAEIWR
jgi:hypothetical protein